MSSLQQTIGSEEDDKATADVGLEMHNPLALGGNEPMPEPSPRTFASKSALSRASWAISNPLMGMLHKATMRVEESKAGVRSVVEDLEAIKGMLKEPWYLVDSEGSFMQKWDLCSTTALIFTALVTPFEVACLPDTDGLPIRELVSDWLWWTNQFVNLFFFADMVVSFFTTYRQSARLGSGVVKSLPLIRRNYIRSWLAIDLVSVFPFGYLPVSGAGTLGILRMVRILRLLKLSRVLRASRIYKRFQSRNSAPHSVESMIQIALVLLILTHWLACAWILAATLQSDHQYTWLDSYSESYFCTGGVCEEEPARLHATSKPSETYYAALYWSVVTVTSVGYGDITPKNPTEMFICTFYLLFGALSWAYIVGEVVTILSTGDPGMIEHHQNMDQLNRFITEKNLPGELSMRLRQFFLSRLSMSRQGGDHELQNKLSPKLLADVSDCVSSWLREFSFLADKEMVSAAFIVELQRELVENIYEPREVIQWRDQLCAMSRGVASIGGILFMTQGYIWGHDCVLDSDDLKDKRSAHALTYVAILSVSKSAFIEVLSCPRFKKERAHIRKKSVLLAVQRAVLAVAARRCAGQVKFSALVKTIVEGGFSDSVPLPLAPPSAKKGPPEAKGEGPGAASGARAAAGGPAEDLVAGVMLETFEEVAKRAEALLASRFDAQRAAIAARLKTQQQALASAAAVAGERALPPAPASKAPAAKQPRLPHTGVPPAPLPDGWTAVLSAAYDGVFYVHGPTGESSWERPGGEAKVRV